ncbi:MAG TPA: hydantoinase/oxoprolinase family protein, partial [Acetobacteraceae bacterium]|nr:hydantoinase/oxoprolinase family protein [Acetobacteraceae bacterium]
YDPDRFAGGALRLDPRAARNALAAHVGGPLGLAPEMAAVGVVEMVDETMANAARVHAIESGKSYEGRTLIAFGGGGPVHACRIAEKLGIARVLVPSGAGVGSAIGFLRAPIAYELVRSLYQRFSVFDVAGVNALLQEMAEEARRIVEQGSFGAALAETRIAYMRYIGQGHEIPVPLPIGALAPGDVAAIRAAFDAAYARFYDRPVPGSDVEVMSFAVRIATEVPEETASGVQRAAYAPSPARSQAVRETTTGAVRDYAVHDRAGLAPGTRVAGPAIIAEDETSTLIAPGWAARIDGFGYIAIERE